MSQLLQAHQFFTDNPGANWRSNCWTDQNEKPAIGWLKWFQDRIDAKINSKDSRYRESKHELAFWRLAQKVNNRIIIRFRSDLVGLPKRIQKRFLHLIDD